MRVITYSDRLTMSRAAAEHAARTLKDTIASRGSARFIAATGASQFDFLNALTSSSLGAEAGGAALDWKRVEMFHLDEYVGVPITHPASFRKYLLERLIGPAGITHYHLIDGETDAPRAVREASRAIAAAPIDVAFVGIGENGHLAFNDPPADFDTTDPYILVSLDEACRRQQVGEGWFKSIDEVPVQAISMSIRQILAAREILCIVPDRRKAEAVKACLEGEISPMAPASILKSHGNTTVYLDRDSASLLSPETRGEIQTQPA